MVGYWPSSFLCVNGYGFWVKYFLWDKVNSPMSVLLENKPVVIFIRNYIQETQVVYFPYL